MRQIATLLCALSLSACLPHAVPQDADSDEDAGLDAGPPRAPRIVGVEVVDHRGAPWPDAMPQWPRLRVELSETPWEGPPMWLFTGPADAELIEDLGDDPLRVATEERVIAATIEGVGTRWTIVPDQRLAPGATVTLGVAAWLRASASGLTMEAPFTLPLPVSEAPEAGARVTASWPPDGAAAVPSAMAALVLRFDGPVEGIADGVALLDADGSAVPGAAAPAECTALGFASGWCATFTPARPLAPSAPHRLVVDESVVDATGAPVGPWEARFTTGQPGEDRPPALIPLPCALDEEAHEGACVLRGDARLAFRLQIDEPARVALSLAGRTLLAVAPRGGAILVAGDLAPDTAYPALLRVEDLAGHVIERSLELRTHPPLPTLSLVEVRADPNGSEPRQEYVEVLNYGSMTVDLEGMAISDRADALGDVVLRSSRLAPGQRALLVADGFDPEDPEDAAPPPGVPLVRIGRSLASGGLTNAGEPLFLRDASARRISAVPAMEAREACVVRIGERRAADEAHFTVGPCTPGTAP